MLTGSAARLRTCNESADVQTLLRLIQGRVAGSCIQTFDHSLPNAHACHVFDHLYSLTNQYAARPASGSATPSCVSGAVQGRTMTPLRHIHVNLPTHLLQTVCACPLDLDCT